jgi:hypothetical protein
MTRSYYTPRKARQVSMQRALVEWHHRLAAELRRQNLAKIAQVHAASARLQPSSPAARQAAPDKQETPPLAGDEASTDAMTLAEVERGCSAECA